jgi:hypothetical protein
LVGKNHAVSGSVPGRLRILKKNETKNGKKMKKKNGTGIISFG